MEKLLAATSRDTVRSRCWTGKPARMLRTEWTDAWEREDSPGTLPMPLQSCSPPTPCAGSQVATTRADGDAVGQIVGRMNEVRPVRDVMFDLVEEFVEASERLLASLDTVQS